MLTRSGPGGVHSWLNGLSDEDRVLLLTCRVCGAWQFVPAREEDDPEILLEEDEEVTPEVREVVAAIVAEAVEPVLPVPALLLPAPRTAVERIVTVPGPDNQALPAASSEAVAAAAQVLAAARAALEVPAPRTVHHARRTRGGPTPRRASARAKLAAAPTPALPEGFGLPAGTHQLVLAAAG